MARPVQLEQSMWEFVYGLLPDDEALAIREQIVADPDVARLYAEVKLRSNLVAEAARLKSPPMQFPVPSAKGAATGTGEFLQPSPSTRFSAVGSAATALRWAVTLAATLLVGFVGYAYLQPQSPLRSLAYQTQRQQLADLPVQAMLLGPGRLQSQPANHLAVLTKSLDGEPRSTEVAYRLYGEDDRLLDEAESQTDAAGILQIKTPAAIADRFVRLEVRTPSDGDAAPLSHTFAVDPAELITHLNLDKPLARPGQTVRFRTVTLNRYSLRADENVAVATEIADGDGNVLAWSTTESLTDRGVRHGEFQIPSDLPDGAYRVVARSPDGQFADVARNLAVREFAAPRFRKQLDFGRESYGPGDQVTANFSVQRAEGGAMSGAELQIQAVVDGQTIWEQDVSTDEQGAFEVTFALPDAIDRGEGQLVIAVGDEATEVLSERIPIQSGTFAVDFFPESGALVAGVENRVYFRARNPQGKAVHVAGRIVDDAGRLHADVRTERDGRGAFSLVPRLDASYRLQIDTPANAGFEPQLPRSIRANGWSWTAVRAFSRPEAI
jgi:alpha-2-macroglobulin-like protein